MKAVSGYTFGCGTLATVGKGTADIRQAIILTRVDNLIIKEIFYDMMGRLCESGGRSKGGSVRRGGRNKGGGVSREGRSKGGSVRKGQQSL